VRSFASGVGTHCPNSVKSAMPLVRSTTWLTHAGPTRPVERGGAGLGATIVSRWRGGTAASDHDAVVSHDAHAAPALDDR
jgi:hypothetical protein